MFFLIDTASSLRPTLKLHYQRKAAYPSLSAPRSQRSLKPRASCGKGGRDEHPWWQHTFRRNGFSLLRLIKCLEGLQQEHECWTKAWNKPHMVTLQIYHSKTLWVDTFGIWKGFNNPGQSLSTSWQVELKQEIPPTSLEQAQEDEPSLWIPSKELPCPAAHTA